MNLLAFQADPTPGPSPPPPPITIDFSGLGKAIVSALTQALPDMGSEILVDLDNVILGAWSKVWNSGANLVGHTDPAWTTHFGPLAAVSGHSHALIYAVLLLALVCILIRSLVVSLGVGGGGALVAIFEDLVVVVAKEAGFFAFLDAMVSAVNAASQVLGWTDAGRMQSLIPDDPILAGVAALVVIFFTVKLFIRGGYRMVWLAILTAFAPAMIALEALPFETCKRWSRMWAQEWLGWLWAQVPSTLALSIGVQLATSVGGLPGLFLVVGFLQVAYDAYGYMTKGSGGGGLLGGLVAGVTGRVGGAMAGGGAGAGLSAAAASAAGITNNQALADRFGY